jgi:cytochrome c5
MHRWLFILAVTAMALAGCKEKPGAGEPGANLLKERCSHCHFIGVKHAHSTKNEWEQTVTKMMGKGAKLSESEKAILVDFLVKYYKPQ